MPDAPATPLVHSSRRQSVATWSYRLAVLMLVAVNAWWLFRESRPLPDLRDIGRSIALRRYEESDRDLRERLRRSPGDGEARMLLARSLAARGDVLGCARELHQVPAWWPTRREALYLEGEAFLAADRARDAEAAWLACAAADPLHPAPTHHRAAVEGLIKLYAAQERWEDARRVAWSLLDSVGTADRPGALVLRLRIEVERIAPETRLARLGRYVAADPDDLASRLGLARAEHAVGREAEATRQIRVCLAARPDDLETWDAWLAMLEARGDIRELDSALHRLPAPAADGATAWSCRGLVRQVAGDIAGAAEAYRRAVERRPLDENLLYRLALLERQLGRESDADALLSRSQTLREARNSLFEALQGYHRAVSASPAESRSRQEASEGLASLCESLGLGREADAIRALMPRS